MIMIFMIIMMTIFISNHDTLTQTLIIMMTELLIDKRLKLVKLAHGLDSIAVSLFSKLQ